MEQAHLDALLAGDVWISTLERCRTHEGGRGDPGEARVDYRSGTIVADGSDPTLQLMAERSGISIGPDVKEVFFSNNASTTQLLDAWVLCTTERFAPKRMEAFGKYCVRIDQPSRFCEVVTNHIVKQCPVHSSLGRVRYRERFYEGIDPAPGPLGFVKPPDIYAEEQEFRMLWTPVTARYSLDPLVVRCPEVRALVSRVA
jgi:hypothetical protein